MDRYDNKDIEEKWQRAWEESGIYRAKESQDKPKSYVLDMFPYPSGEGLHVGHPKGYIATDVYARHKRMTGHEVLHPMGWDAFGLPAENYAIKNKMHPRIAVEKNVARFKEQLRNIGFDYDWTREVNTTDPAFYKWTQWIFLQLYKKGLAFQSNEPINWCPSCKTGLANEDLDGSTCERCGSVIEKKALPQWVLRITDYADRLLDDLSLLPEWPEHIKESQRNWIGRSEGAQIKFGVKSEKFESEIEVFTTRPDTLFGVTYVVLAPEHPLIGKLTIENKDEVVRYIESARSKTEIERAAEGREKTGVELKGVRAINPANGEEVPVWVADYVLGDYGTGAVMAVPAHDERDFEFAKKFGLPILAVIIPEGNIAAEHVNLIYEGTQESVTTYILNTEPYLGEGLLIGSKDFNLQKSTDAKQKITEYVGGKWVTKYKLRDWVFSRQRYWGEPIPLIHCEKCAIVPVPEAELPVLLPDVESYEPSGTGESPLAAIESWVNTTCPACGGAAKRETNTMPQWAGSSWYYLRYMDPCNDAALVAPGREKYWAPVDLYVGGAEHATRHLIYARFWHKFLYDIGIVTTKEPFMELHSVGLILAEDGRKMSKRYGNVVNPDDIVAQFGADSLRVYEMFMGPFENAIAWSTDGLVGARRFLERVWRYGEKVESKKLKAKSLSPALDSLIHQTIKKVGDDIESFKHNTAVSALMILLNAMEKEETSSEEFGIFLRLLAPFAPHITEELWHRLGHTSSIHTEAWPTFDASKLVLDNITIAVQIGGKVRGTCVVSKDANREAVEAAARAAVADRLAGAVVEKVIIVQGRLVNFVVAQ